MINNKMPFQLKSQRAFAMPSWW